MSLTQTVSISSVIISVPHLPAVLAGLQEVLGSDPGRHEQGRSRQRGGQHQQVPRPQEHGQEGDHPLPDANTHGQGLAQVTRRQCECFFSNIVWDQIRLIHWLNFEQVKKIRRLARKPYRPQDHDAIKECCNKFTEGKSSELLKKILARRYRKSPYTLKDVQEKCGRQVSCESGNGNK